MVAFPLAQRLILPVASTGGGLVAALVGVMALAVPTDLLDAAAIASGLPAVLAAAEPPLGLTARIGLAAVLGTLLGSLTWFALHFVCGTRTLALPLPRRRMAAPPTETLPRRPLMAEELGTPFLEVTAPKPKPVERPLPIDLDAPLAAFDPAAIPELPAEPSRAVASLYRKAEAVQAPGERFEAFALPRVPVLAITPDAEPMLGARTEATVHALLERLERGVAQRAKPAKSQCLQNTLAELRTLAVRG